MITAQLPLGVQLRDRPDFDSYYAGPNRDVVGALYEIASGHSSGLYLYGSHGQGKSHLLQACGHAADRASRSSVYLPLAELASAGPEALAGYESRQLICLDDIDAVVAQRACWTAAAPISYRSWLQPIARSSACPAPSRICARAWRCWRSTACGRWMTSIAPICWPNACAAVA